MISWTPLTRRVFRGVFPPGEDPNTTKPFPRDCLIEPSDTRADCPNSFEDYVNSFSVSLRVSERMDRLTKLLRALDNLHGLILRFNEGQNLEKTIIRATNEAISASPNVISQLPPAQGSNNTVDTFCNHLKSQIERYLSVQTREPIRRALQKFNVIKHENDYYPDEYGIFEADFFAYVRKRQPDSRLIIHLAGIADRNSRLKDRDYTEQVLYLLEYIKHACKDAEADWIENPDWSKLHGSVVELCLLVLEEIRNTVRADCAFLENLSTSSRYVFGEAIAKYEINAVTPMVTRTNHFGQGGGGGIY